LTSSNQTETTAVLRALLAFKQTLIDRRIHALSIQSDNAVTVFNLQRQGAGPALLRMTREIFKLLQKLDIRLHIQHIPGVQNVLVDSLSRMEATGDFALRPDLFLYAIRTLRVEPTIDLFAHSKNNKCPRFCALPSALSGSSEISDAFSIPWTREIPYIFPPVQIIDKVLQKIVQERVTALLVVPRWPTQPWWGLLRPIAKTVLVLGRSQDILIPGPAMLNSTTKKTLPPALWLMVLATPTP
jgi:hypothetical protein